MSLNTDTQASLSRFEFFATDAQGGMTRYDQRSAVHPSYSHIVTGGFGTGQGADIFCYSSSQGQGDIWTRTDQGGVLWQSSTPLRKGCTLVVAANQAGDANHDIVLYNPTEGTIDVHRVDAPGKLTLLKTTTGVPKTWTAVAMGGNYGSGSYHKLFFYDAAAGRGVFYLADGSGGLKVVGDNTGLRKGCTLVASGSFCDGPSSDIMLHDPVTGQGVFYKVEEYVMKEIYTATNWRKTFTRIIVGKWSDSPYSDLAQYDAVAGQLLLRSLDGKGGIATLKTHDVPKDWTTFEGAGGFKSGPSTPTKDHIVFYNRTVGADVPVTPPPTTPDPTPTPTQPKFTGKLALFTLDDWGMLGKQKEITGLRNWTNMLSGSFSRGSYNKILNPDGDLFFYDAATGDAETVKVGADGKLTTIGKFTGLPKNCRPVVFTYQQSDGGIMLYGPKTGAHLYDATLGKMTFLKTIPLLDLPNRHIIRGSFSAQPGSNEFVFSKRTSGVDIALVKLTDQLELRVASRKKVASAFDEEENSAIVAGRFVGNSNDDYLTYGNTYGTVRVFRGGNNGDDWFDYFGNTPQLKLLWDTMIPVGLKSNGGFRESILAYSYGKQRAETMEVGSVGNLNTVKHYDNLGQWNELAPMPSFITRRVAFFRRTGG